jgi:hypothetical protein
LGGAKPANWRPATALIESWARRLFIHGCIDGEKKLALSTPWCHGQRSMTKHAYYHAIHATHLTAWARKILTTWWRHAIFVSPRGLWALESGPSKSASRLDAAIEATVVQWRQTETRRSNKVDWTNFTNKSQRVRKSAHWSSASRYDFLIDTSSSPDASVEVTSSS